MSQRTTSKTTKKPESRGKTIPISKVQAPMLATYGALPATGFIRQRELLEIVPFSASTLWRRVKQGSFVVPVRLSERVTAWRCEDVRAWLDAQGAQV